MLLLDEPTSQLDRGNRDAVARLLLELRAEYRPTVIAVTHDAALAAGFEQVVRLRDGKVER